LGEKICWKDGNKKTQKGMGRKENPKVKMKFSGRMEPFKNGGRQKRTLKKQKKECP